MERSRDFTFSVRYPHRLPVCDNHLKRGLSEIVVVRRLLDMTRPSTRLNRKGGRVVDEVSFLDPSLLLCCEEEGVRDTTSSR